MYVYHPYHYGIGLVNTTFWGALINCGIEQVIAQKYSGQSGKVSPLEESLNDKKVHKNPFLLNRVIS